MNDDELFLSLAYKEASKSPDPHTQNGAVIVNHSREFAIGCNSFASGVSVTAERLVKPAKYDWILHAEHVAVLNAAKTGFATKGATMYCPWFACTDCALAIAQSGIKCVVGHSPFYEAANKTWEEKTNGGINILKEANVEMRWFGGKVSHTKPVLVAGKLFCPKGETTNVAS